MFRYRWGLACLDEKQIKLEKNPYTCLPQSSNFLCDRFLFSVYQTIFNLLIPFTESYLPLFEGA